ncbi:MAG TPA: dephospho-CoA kinase [Lacipirellulaceae bacterium]|nr:dephospho-CoA kinase [Lacipirellulaceae bacterium]
MHTIGLIGGIACGKSAVAAALARRGAVVFDADKLGHRVLLDPDVRSVLTARWGHAVLGPDGELDRSAIAKIVFGPAAESVAERRFLESVVHPGIRRQIEAGIRGLTRQTPAAVVDAALLVEAGWSDVCSAIVWIECPQNERQRRAAARGWSADEFTRREAAQLPIEVKRRYATHMIDNSGPPERLEAAVAEFWDGLGRGG